MVRAAVLASGNGSNFQALVEALIPTEHKIAGLICDKKEAGCFKRAKELNIPSRHISYRGREREAAEREIIEILTVWEVRIIFLAGFMRLLSPLLIDRFPGNIINIHPALLPGHPGTRGIEESFFSKDEELGITIHRVDYGMDTGPVLFQASFNRRETPSLQEAEARIHQLEHIWYPRAALKLLDEMDEDSRPSQ